MEMRKDKNLYISRLAKSKELYHKKKAKMPYEEKVKIILELQKINVEMRAKSKRKTTKHNKKVWDVVI